LDYEVSILRIHETNSKSPIRAGKVWVPENVVKALFQ
jgi:hypothetical protein